MKALASLLLAFSLSATHPTLPDRHPIGSHALNRAHQRGQWYLAESGHAVFCYGPVMTLTQPKGGIRRVATFCQGAKIIVPLRD